MNSQAGAQSNEVDGYKRYTPLGLSIYDALVIGVIIPNIWRCRRESLIANYSRHAGARHLDIGVGTGYFIDQCKFHVAQPEITLMDMNENSLRIAAQRLARYAPRTIKGSVLAPFELGSAKFDSIGMNALLHCLPGNWDTKVKAFEYAKACLAPRGVVFGCTVLGRGVEHTGLSTWFMDKLNRIGAFTNKEDDLAGFERALSAHFVDPEVKVEGAFAIFSARTAR